MFDLYYEIHQHLNMATSFGKYVYEWKSLMTYEVNDDVMKII